MAEKESKTHNWPQIAFASYGAIVATVALCWNIFQYVDNKPKLEVQIDTESVLPNPLSSFTLNLPAIHPVARFLNKGSKPLTIYYMQADFQSSGFHPFVMGSQYNHDPMKLDVGDAKEWSLTGCASSPASLEDLPQSQLVPGKLHVLVLTTSGKYEQTSTVTIRSKIGAPPAQKDSKK